LIYETFLLKTSLPLPLPGGLVKRENAKRWRNGESGRRRSGRRRLCRERRRSERRRWQNRGIVWLERRQLLQLG
jgi:hypothetical protein